MIDDLITRLAQARVELAAIADELFPEDEGFRRVPWCPTCGYPLSREPYGCPDSQHARPTPTSFA